MTPPCLTHLWLSDAHLIECNVKAYFCGSGTRTGKCASSDEAKQILRQFPNANALIVHEDLPGSDCAEVVKFAKQQRPSMPAVALSISDTFVCDGIDHQCSTHNPDELLQLLRKLFGDPRQLDESNQAVASHHGNKNQRPNS